MKNINILLYLVMTFLSINYTNAQTISVSINSTFGADQIIYAFNSADIIYGLEINGSVSLNTDTSLARIILVDNNNAEYLVYESYPLLDTIGTISFTDVGDETFYLNAISPLIIKVELINATINISSIVFNKTILNNATTLRSQYINSRRLLKIAAINNNIQEKGLLWAAGDNALAQMSFNEKKKMFSANKLPNLCGFEYYIGGIFQMPSFQLETTSSTFVDIFDWRNRHGTNWITSVKNQGSENSCWAHGAMASLEAVINLYYNQHIDEDLSEQAFVSCYNGMYRSKEVLGLPAPPLPQCDGINTPTDVLCKVKELGAVDESCYPYTNVYDLCGVDVNNQACPFNPFPNSCTICGNLCSDYSQRLWKIEDFRELVPIPTHSYQELLTETALQEYIILNGPIGFTYSPWGHTMCFVGFGVVKEDDIIYLSSGPIIVPAGDPRIGQVYWIVKNSGGIGWGENGFCNFFIDLTGVTVASIIKTPITQPTTTSYQVNCEDADGDGYFYWGIGLKPTTGPNACPVGSSNEEDCDDSNPFLGPYATDYSCSVNCDLFTYNSTPYTVSSDESWDFEKWMNKDVIINAGCTLTINSKVIFEHNAKVIVKQGGYLIIDGGTLTTITACSDNLWQGIEVQGDKTLRQFPETNQGIVEIINGGTIENALQAINTIKTVNNVWDYNGTGGIVKANGAIFINNREGICFLSYHNRLPNGTITDNISYIQNCTFETNSLWLVPSQNPLEFIMLNDVEGVRIKGNTFKNTNPAPTAPYVKGTGILIYNSSCTISGLCTSNIIPCNAFQPNTFENLNYAITILNFNSLKTVTISNNEFINNYSGIALKYANNSVITSNHFEIPDIMNLYPLGSYGLYVESCSGYKIEGNEFQSVASQLGMYGVAFKTFTNQVSNTLYHNRFTGLSIGVLTANSFPPPSLLKAVSPQQPILFIPGLQIKCNRFEDITNKDIAITSGQIGSPQGKCITVTSPANNMFSFYGTNPDRDIFVNPGAGPFGYCHSTDVLTTPVDYTNTNNKVSLLPCSAFPVFIETNSCPSTLNIIIDQTTTMSVIAGLNAQINTLVSVIDGGNTQSLLNNVNSNINSGQLRDILLAPGPYLSDTVLIAVIKKTNPVPPGILKEIIVPNSPVTTPVMNAINTVNLPAGIMQEIQTVQTGTSERAVLEQQITTLQQQKDSATAELMRYYLNDTTGIKIDSVILFLESQTDLESQKQLITAYLMQENCAEAIAVLDSLPQQSEEDIVFKEFYDIMLELCSQGNTVFELTPEQEQTIRLIAATNTTTSTAAKSVLTMVYGEYYPEIIEELFEQGEAGIKGNLYESFECGGEPVSDTKIYLFDENNEIVTSVSPAITDSTGFFWFNNYYLSLLDTTALYSINTTGGFKIDNPGLKTIPEWFGSGQLTLNLSKVNMEWSDYYSSVDSLYNGGNAIDLNGNIYVAGYTAFDPFNVDFLTIKYSPTGERLWVKTYNGTGNGADQAFDIAVDNNNNCYVLGSSVGAGTGNDMMLIKYNSDGNQLWANRYNSATSNEDVPVALAVDPSGGVYVTGYTKPDITSSNILTIKYSNTGSVQWIKTYSNFPGNVPSDIKIDMFGNIIVLGTTSSGTNNDYVTIKYNKNGSRLWVKLYDSGFSDNSQALAVDNNNNILVTGASYNLQWNMATVKYNPSGVQQWLANTGGRPNDITTDNSGYIYITGWYNTNGVTIKYKPDGVEQWKEYYTSSYINGVDALQAINLDKNNDVYVTGWSATAPYATKSSEIITIKYDKDGNEKWRGYISGSLNLINRGNDIVVSDNLNVYITGLINTNGLYKMTTAKYSQCPSTTGLKLGMASGTDNESDSDIQVINFNENTITVYPNPYSDNTLIEMILNSDADVSLEVYTLTGQCIADIYYGFAVKGEYSYNFSAKKLGYSAGTYILKATVNNEVSSYWLVEMK